MDRVNKELVSAAEDVKAWSGSKFKANNRENKTKKPQTFAGYSKLENSSNKIFYIPEVQVV